MKKIDYLFARTIARKFGFDYLQNLNAELAQNYLLTKTCRIDMLAERAFWINSTHQRIKRGVTTRQTIKRVILATPLF